MRKKLGTLAIVSALSVLFVGCQNRSEDEQVNIKKTVTVKEATDTDEVRNMDTAKRLTEQLLTIPRGTKELETWYSDAEKLVSEGGLKRTGVEGYYKANLPLQAYYDENPNFFNTGGANPVEYKVLSVEVIGQPSKDSYTISVFTEVSVGTHQTKKNHVVDVVLKDEKIDDIGGSFLDEYQAVSSDSFNTLGDSQMDDEHQAVLAKLEEAVADVYSQEYYKGYPTEEYLTKFWNGVDDYSIRLFTGLANQNPGMRLTPMKTREVAEGVRYEFLVTSSEDVVLGEVVVTLTNGQLEMLGFNRIGRPGR